MPVIQKRTKRAVKPAEVSRDDFLFAIDGFLDKTLAVPDIIEFALSDQYLGRSLYPIQGTILKIAFLQPELFTSFDLDVIDWWSNSFALTETYGTQPDILERISINIAQGRKWFHEWVNIIGRRGSKGFIGGIGGSYVLWHYLVKGDPQDFYGVTRDKRLSAYVFAGKKSQAQANQWRDLTSLITGGRCFEPYLPQRPLSESLVVFAPNDFVRIADREAIGQFPRHEDLATFEIVPKESTLMAARGPATFLLMFDEMAHVSKSAGASADASDVYSAAIPSLDQFKMDSWIYEGSSPWQMLGQFYENWQDALHVSDGTDGFSQGHITRPEMFMLQIPSWDPYVNWQEADQIPLRPITQMKEHAFTYPKQKVAMQEYDDELKKLEASNPEKFRVERRSWWASVLDAYLNPERVEQAFYPWEVNGVVQNVMRNEGKPLETYIAHGDPAAVNDNFGFAIAHKINIAGETLPHVVIDFVTHWEPASFVENNYEVDYEYIVDQFKGYIYRFHPIEFTTDQAHSTWMLQQLRSWFSKARLPFHTNFFQRIATKKLNWEMAETFKTALNMNLVHIPAYPQARSELLFLQKTGADKVEAPTTGPIQHDDVAWTLFNLVHSLIGEHIAKMVGDSFPQLSGSQMGGFSQPQVAPRNPDSSESRIEALRGAGRRGPAPYAPSRGSRFSQPARRR
jgi:hypothetical protein